MLSFDGLVVTTSCTSSRSVGVSSPLVEAIAPPSATTSSGVSCVSVFDYSQACASARCSSSSV